MAQEIIGLKVEVDGSSATQSVGSIKQQLKEANLELINAQKQFGDYSKEAVNAAKKVAQLKDSVQEAAETASLFDPGKKFQAFAGALSSVAGGFTAVQGALGLVGVESQNVEKSLLKVQSALALSQGLSTVADSVKDFQRLAAIIQQSTVFTKAFQVATALATTIQRAFGVAVTGTGIAFKALRAAIISTGIGALVVGLGFVVEKLITWASSASEAEKAQERLAASTRKMNGEIDNQIAVLTALGGKEEQIYKLRLQRTDNELNVLRNKLKTQGKLSEDELAQFKKLKTDKEVLDIQESNRIKKNQEEADKKAKDNAEKARQDNQKAFEENKRLREKEAEEEQKQLERQQEAKRSLLTYNRDVIRNDEKEAREKAKKEQEAYQKQQDISSGKQLAGTIATAQEVQGTLSGILNTNTQNARDQYIALLNFQLSSSNDSYAQQAQLFEQIRLLERQKLVDRRATQAELDLFDKQTKEEELKREQAVAEAKAAVISNALGAVADAVGRNTVAGKALAVAQASIDTYVGANKALATYPPPFGAIAAGTVVLSGLLNVKKILSTKLPAPPGAKSFSDSSGSSSVPTVSTNNAPLAPTQPQAQLTQLTQGTINQLGSATNRAYVVETDITNSQERIARINRAARLG